MLKWYISHRYFWCGLAGIHFQRWFGIQHAVQRRKKQSNQSWVPQKLYFAAENVPEGQFWKAFYPFISSSHFKHLLLFPLHSLLKLTSLLLAFSLSEPLKILFFLIRPFKDSLFRFLFFSFLYLMSLRFSVFSRVALMKPDLSWDQFIKKF